MADKGNMTISLGLYTDLVRAIEEAKDHIRSVCGTDDRPNSDNGFIVKNCEDVIHRLAEIEKLKHAAAMKVANWEEVIASCAQIADEAALACLSRRAIACTDGDLADAMGGQTVAEDIAAKIRARAEIQTPD